MIRQKVGSLLLLLASVTLAFLLAEALVRPFFPLWAPRTARITSFWRYDARYGWSHIPGATGAFQSHGIRANVVINSRGFRGPEVQYARGGEAGRVLVLGDSFVWGFGVEADEMFTTRLAKLLPHLEIVNLGVSGYSTDQELLLYEDEGRKYRADLVILVVSVNDMPGNAQTIESVIYGKPAFVIDADGTLRLVNEPVARTPWLKRVMVQVAWRSYILTRLNRYLYERQVVTEGGVERRTSFPHFGMEKVTARLLVEFKQAVERDGSRFLVVLVDGFGPDGRAMSGFMSKSGIDHLLLDGPIDFNDPAQHLPDGLHWSPAGHAIVANVLAAGLKDRLEARINVLSTQVHAHRGGLARSQPPGAGIR